MLLHASLAIAAPSAADRGDVRLPPGTRADATGQLVSRQGLRDTSDFLAKELARRGIVTRQVGPYRVRGVELTRFISQTATTPWLAIHVMRSYGRATGAARKDDHAGKTLIFFVPRPNA